MDNPENVTPVGSNARDDEKPPEHPPIERTVQQMCHHPGDGEKFYRDLEDSMRQALYLGRVLRMVERSLQ